MHQQTETELKNRIFNITADDFESLAIAIFNFQHHNNDNYRAYCNALKINPDLIKTLTNIPFLPIQFFKSRTITTSTFTPQIIFESSGTTGAITSKHYIKDLSVYENSFFKAFEIFYGNINEYCILGLLPSYLERNNASLVYMVDKLIQKSNNKKSGFFLAEFDKLHDTIKSNELQNQKTLLIGVSYALVDFTEQFPMQLKHTIVMETGGMKGRREEMTKESLHQLLKEQLGVAGIHSEYGMTELLSQAYSYGNGIFNCPPWMKIMLRAEDNPLETLDNRNNNIANNTGAVNIIDLANINSCSFIATDDLGRCYKDGSFEIIGRLEDSDIRGCGLMII